RRPDGAAPRAPPGGTRAPGAAPSGRRSRPRRMPRRRPRRGGSAPARRAAPPAPAPAPRRRPVPPAGPTPPSPPRSPAPPARPPQLGAAPHPAGRRGVDPDAEDPRLRAEPPRLHQRPPRDAVRPLLQAVVDDPRLGLQAHPRAHPDGGGQQRERVRSPADPDQ